MVRFIPSPRKSTSKEDAMSPFCENFIKAILQKSWGNAFLNLNGLNMFEMLRGLAALDPDDLSDLLRTKADSTNQVNMPRIEYAAEVVQTRRLPEAAPGDLQQTGQVQDALNFIHKPTPLVFENDLTGRLPAPNPNPPRLGDDDFHRSATELGVEVAAIRAVASVESGGRSGFGDGNRPVLRYELHVFDKRTHGKYHRTHPHLSQPTLAAGNPYHVGGQVNEYSLLHGAMILRNCVETAWESASWGMFQIMGFNHSGFGDVGSFVAAMYNSEGEQMRSFLAYCRGAGLANALRTHDWAGFARGYNGAGYAVNHYDVNIANAYARFSAG
jgi:hypothetical protein